MHISDYVSKTWLQELGILLKCRETFEKFLTACNYSKNIALPKFFSKFSDKCILRTSIVLYFNGVSYPIRSLIYTKCKKKYLTWLLTWVPKTFDFSKFLCSILSSHFRPLKNKPNESCKNSKKLEINALSTMRKAFKRKRK